jgi:hypothetical protein
MFRFFTPRRLAFLALAALALPVALAGCGKKITSVDADYTQIEGTPDANARLIAWTDLPTTVWTWTDNGQPGATNDDVLQGTSHVYRSGPGHYQAMLLDGSLASGFEMFRRASNGGYEPMRDFVVNAPRKWLDSHWELYTITDASPSGFSPPTYLGRGLLSGTITSRSPLTNPATVTASVDTVLKYFGNRVPTDSLFTMAWSAVTGAAGYWIHVYQLRSDISKDELVQSGTPSPVWNGKVRDYLVAYVDAPTTTYKYGAPGALVLTKKAPLRGQVYFVRITAVDGNGQIVGYMAGDNGFIQGDKIWTVFPLGASAVNPGGHAGPALAPARAGPAGTAPGTFGIPGFRILGPLDPIDPRQPWGLNGRQR